MNNNIGALSALRGYRKQFLYSLFRILCATTEENTFHPEGKFEDLDIYDKDEHLIEIIQVKDLTAKLTLSDILNSKESSFIKRALNFAKDGITPIVKLVSYGAINEDIQKLASNNYDNKLKNRLKSFGLKEKDIVVLEKYFCYEIVSEGNISKIVRDKIKETNFLSDLDVSLDLLIYWIYKTAERQNIINKVILNEQLLCIGKFEKEREGFHKYFNSLIKPLVNQNIDVCSFEKLKNDFYQGVSATYNHILANVDVIREEKLHLLNDKFKETNILFVHGASGQGKSSLCYRYLHDFCTSTTVFTLNKLPNDIHTIYEVISSLEGISKGLTFPITLYIDVDPGQKEWINIIKELSSKTNFNFLVSIREEDWNSIQIQDLFRFQEIELLFDKYEASQIYNSLNETYTDLYFLDFEDAWDVFGENGPLLEFVYLITQKESLPSKLRSQINTIINDDSTIASKKIKFLRYITLADSYGAEVSYKAIGKYLDYTDFKQLTELLEREYLLKIIDNNTIITGLHPVRSTIIKNILFDNEVFCEADYALDAIAFINDNSFLNFYRNIFKYTPLAPDNFIEHLRSIKLNSWQSYYSILVTLLWKGIDDYVTTNLLILDQIYEEYGNSWIIVVNFDFCEILEGKSILMENSDLFSEEQKEFARSVNKNLSDKQLVFKYCISWLHEIPEISLNPEKDVDWDSFSLFVFWMDYFNIENIQINKEKIDISSIISSNYSLSTLSHLMYAFSRSYFINDNLLSDLEPIFLKSIYNEYNILNIQREKDEITCLYFWDIIDEKIETKESDIIHAKSIKIIDLLRFAYPDFVKYKIKGFGHKFSFITDDYDSSHKAISVENLPLSPLVEVNSTFVNLYKNYKRPNSWQEYVNKILYSRQKFIETLQRQHTALVLYHKKKSFSSLSSYILDYGNSWGLELSSIVMKDGLLPQSVVDKWGNTSEGQSKTNSNLDMFLNKRGISIEKYKDFLDQHRDYSSSIENYLRQSAFSVLRTIKERIKEDISDSQDLRRISLVGNLYKAFIVLPSFQKSFRDHFEKFVDKHLLLKIENAENKLISELCFLYSNFLYSSSFINGNASSVASTRLIQSRHSLQKNIEKTLQKVKSTNNISFKIFYDKISGSCLIVANFESCIDSLSNLSLIYNALSEAIGTPDATSIKALIVEKYFSSIYILPLVRGRSQDLKWYQFKSYNLVDKNFEELAPFNLIPQDISSNIVDDLNIQEWYEILDDIGFLKELLTCVNMMQLLVFSFKQYKDIGEVEDDFGVDIFLKYIKKTNTILQEHFQKGIDLFSKQLNLCNNGYYEYNDAFEENELLQIMLEAYPLFYPDEKYAKNDNVQLELKPEDIEIWLPRLEKLNEKIAIIYYAYSDITIRKHS